MNKLDDIDYLGDGGTTYRVYFTQGDERGHAPVEASSKDEAKELIEETGREVTKVEVFKQGSINYDES